MPLPDMLQQQPPTGRDVFQYARGAERVEYLRSLGARNVEPPLPKTNYLRQVVRDRDGNFRGYGKIVAWTPGLAAQTDIAVNCDDDGNPITREEAGQIEARQSRVPVQDRQLPPDDPDMVLMDALDDLAEPMDAIRKAARAYEMNTTMHVTPDGVVPLGMFHAGVLR